MSRPRAVALVALIVGVLVTFGCADDSGVIERPTTTTVDLPRSGP